MGTNYYATSQPCPHCGRTDEPVHIGKSAAGWAFALHVIPDEGLITLDAWVKYLEDKVIADEYGNQLSLDEMLNKITKRSWRQRDDAPLGYVSWRDFYNQNHAEPGPNNLSRQRIDGRHCIGHGEGTWDYCQGEFS